MFVHGGISEEDQYLNDCHLLNFQPLKWSQCTLNLESQAPLLAWHSACLVMPYDLAFHPKFNIYKLPEIVIGRRAVSKVIIKNNKKINSSYIKKYRLKKEVFIYLEENHQKTVN
jgi:hypothetical protein